jgi:hypothetical protein
MLVMEGKMDLPIHHLVRNKHTIYAFIFKVYSAVHTNYV